MTEDPTHPVARDERFIEQLLTEVPELQCVFVAEPDLKDPLLTYSFLSAVARFVEAFVSQWVARGNESDESREVVARILEVLERGLALGDGEIENLIAVGFAESVDPRLEGYPKLRGMMGPRLLEWMKVEEDAYLHPPVGVLRRLLRWVLPGGPTEE